MQIQNFRAPLTAEQITRSLEAYLMWLFGKVMCVMVHLCGELANVDTRLEAENRRLEDD